MSFWLLFHQLVSVLSIWFKACWLFSYYLSTQFYHEMALHVAAIAKSTLNMFVNWGSVPCPFPWLFGIKPVPALILLSWMVYCSCLHQCISIGWAEVWELGCSLSPGIIQGKVNALNHFVGCQRTHETIAWGLIAIIFSSQDFCHNFDLLIMRRTSLPGLHN